MSAARRGALVISAVASQEGMRRPPVVGSYTKMVRKNKTGGFSSRIAATLGLSLAAGCAAICLHGGPRHDVGAALCGGRGLVYTAARA
jgi:hypothetical protein